MTIERDKLQEIIATIQANKSSQLDLSKVSPKDKVVNGIDDAQLVEILEVMASVENLAIREINLNSNSITSDGMESLARFIKEHPCLLTSLNLGCNRNFNHAFSDSTKKPEPITIEGTGVAILARVLEGTTITTLILDSIEMRDEGAKALARVLNKTAIKHLDIKSNYITVEGMKALADALPKNTTLERLNVNHNSISSEDVVAFIKSLAHNATLTRLDAGTSEYMTDKDLIPVLLYNTTLQQLNVSIIVGQDDTGFLTWAVKAILERNVGLVTQAASAVEASSVVHATTLAAEDPMQVTGDGSAFDEADIA